MTDYNAPIKDMMFVLKELADLEGVAALPGFEEATPELVEAVLNEAGKLAAGVLAPLNYSGNLEGASCENGEVRTASGWKAAYDQFVDGGWNGIGFPAERGGMGLPWAVATPVQEMWHASNMAFGLCPLLTQGAIEAIELHGSTEQKNTYLPKMIPGNWTGTMNLTEPQAGSDLGAIKTRATPEADHYLISGQKIYITYGDHDLTENIIHLVLARTPDAPEGVKGISLFIVPKFLPDDAGNPAERNDVNTVSIEHKLGINASPTCVLSFGDNGGAKGFLVGEENQGLVYMFTMMNMARHAVAVEGAAIADRAYQQALAYAQERIQGKPIGQTGDERLPIIHHPDVRRMLGLMKSRIEAMRATCAVWASHFDKSRRHPDETERKRQFVRMEFLTPIAKGWCTEVANEVAYLGVQIHGGMGFIEQTGAAQHYRDARITTIYEGTTGIQAADLVGRKTLRDGGEAARSLIETMSDLDNDFNEWSDPALDDIRAHLAHGIDDLTEATKWLLETGAEDPRMAMAVSVPYLMLWGNVVGGWLLAKSAIAAKRKLDGGDSDSDYLVSKIHSARFYALHVLTATTGLSASITSGADSVFDFEIKHLQVA